MTPPRPPAARNAAGRPAAARPGAAPLLVVCALAPERWALRGGDWTVSRETGEPAAEAMLIRTGMGPERARRSVSALLEGGSGGGRDYGALLITGFCAAVALGIHPGEAIVPEEVSHGGGASVEIASSGLLAGTLCASGLTVHTGRLHSAERVVHGAGARGRLRAAGVVGVDLETAAVLDAARQAAPGLPAAAMRIVVDTPGRELLRPGTVPNGIRAWHALRAAVPAFVAWHRALASPGDPPDRTPTPTAIPTPETLNRTLPQEAS